ncbi:type I secretion target repeat protein [Oceaniovalibus guishaninsula JLT2003]|uniref:Type I secretion target repeat protein n=1 Tax=Oceaniovalibus guishaninsula JLT2003 TaxID=1231392 RepID=K2HAG9_9RHOB|nr:CAP domain-containing protein [Oceaniovalibus guishaninsula]EKE44523.1 type I secretion target repeat protein [Oceaniovalibus guishaninsula JLT2003]
MAAATEFEHYMLGLVNAARAEHGLGALKMELNLNLSADRHSDWVLETDTFSHTGVEGTKATERIEAAGFDLSGGWATGENLAIQSLNDDGSWFDEIDDMFDSLMKSPGHRANILSDKYTHVGIGIDDGAFAFDKFNTRDSLMVTQNFGMTHGTVDLDLLGGDKADRLTGGTGDDHLRGAGGDDLLDGRGGNDTIDGGKGTDTAVIGADWDPARIAHLSDGGVRIRSDAGTDVFYSVERFRFADRVVTADGLQSGAEAPPAPDDGQRIKGTGRSDTLKGGDGDDWIDGGKRHDTIAGGGGDDTITGGLGRDKVNMGDGDDLYLDHGQGGRLGQDIVRGGAGDDTIKGRGGNDRFFGGTGDDAIYGGAGNDTIRGGSGDDFIKGGTGRDRVLMGGGNDFYQDSGQNGFRGRDVVRAGSGNDTIEGGGGNDRFFGQRGDDSISGGRMHDVLKGGSGDDTIYGGSGNDTMVGGTGHDTFVFDAKAQNDVIRDFDLAEDRLHLNDDLWRGQMDAQDVVDRYASQTRDGVLFDFGGGNTLMLDDVTGLDRLADAIDIV